MEHFDKNFGHVLTIGDFTMEKILVFINQQRRK